MGKNKQYQQKRMNILRGFSELITDYGLENVSISKLAGYLKIPASLIFYYFNDKEELVNETVDYVLEVCLEKSKMPFGENQDLDPQEEFSRYMEKLFLGFQDSQETFHLRAYYVCYNLALRDNDTRKKFYDHQEALRQNFRELLEYFAERGSIKVNNVNEAVELLFCMITGVENAMDFIDDEDRKRKAGQKCLDLFLDYLERS